MDILSFSSTVRLPQSAIVDLLFENGKAPRVNEKGGSRLPWRLSVMFACQMGPKARSLMRIPNPTREELPSGMYKEKPENQPGETCSPSTTVHTQRIMSHISRIDAARISVPAFMSSGLIWFYGDERP
jgi:hypothetical protein